MNFILDISFFSGAFQLSVIVCHDIWETINLNKSTIQTVILLLWLYTPVIHQSNGTLSHFSISSIWFLYQ